MPTTADILWLVVLPAVASIIAMAATRPWRRLRDLGGWGAALAIVATFGLAVAHHWYVPSFPPPSAQGWLFYLAAAALVIAVVHTLRPWDIVGIVLSCLLLLVTPLLLLKGQQATMEPAAFWLWTGGTGVAMVLWWLVMEPLGRRSRGGSLPLILALVALVSGVAIMAANTQTAGRTVAALAIPLVVIGVAGWWARGRVLGRGGMLVVALLLPGMLLFAHFFADGPIPYIILLALAPLAAWAGEMRGLGERDSWKRVAVRWAVVGAMVALPLVVSVRGLAKLLQEQRQPYEYRL
jgi:hypothetical protein